MKFSKVVLPALIGSAAALSDTQVEARDMQEREAIGELDIALASGLTRWLNKASGVQEKRDPTLDDVAALSAFQKRDFADELAKLSERDPELVAREPCGALCVGIVSGVVGPILIRAMNKVWGVQTKRDLADFDLSELSDLFKIRAFGTQEKRDLADEVAKLSERDAELHAREPCGLLCIGIVGGVVGPILIRGMNKIWGVQTKRDLANFDLSELADLIKRDPQGPLALGLIDRAMGSNLLRFMDNVGRQQEKRSIMDLATPEKRSAVVFNPVAFTA